MNAAFHRPHAALLTALAALLVAPTARADRRIFAFTYPSMTLPQGGFEIEHYLDADLALRDDPSTAEQESLLLPDWEQQLEFEMGLTDRWDLGFYNVVRQRPYQGLSYRGAKLRTRYRFSDRGEWWVDPAIYLEVAYKGDEIELEQRIILNKVFDRVEVGCNLKVEEEWKLQADGVETEFKLVPSAAVGYHFTEQLALGAEYLGELVWEGAQFEHHHWVGPTLSIAGTHWWWTVTVAPALTGLQDQPSFAVRSLFAVVF